MKEIKGEYSYCNDKRMREFGMYIGWNEEVNGEGKVEDRG